MGGCRLGGQLVATCLDRDHGLDACGRPRRRHELARIGDGFQIHDDGPRAGVARQ